jgi:rubrerythrin
MGKFKPVKKTTFLEAVASAIDHETRVFEYYHRNAETLPGGPIKDLFFQLAAEVDEHIKMIKEIFENVSEGQALPNLKMMSAVGKFHQTSLQVLMRKLDRNTQRDAGGDELEAVSLATQEHEDAAEFYRKMAGKFEDPNIRFLFHRLANFQDENRMFLESYSTYATQGTPYSQPTAYWEEDLL